MPWPSATTSNRGRVLVACTCRVTLLVGGATVKQPHPPWSGGSLAIWLQPAQRPREIAGLVRSPRPMPGASHGTLTLLKHALGPRLSALTSSLSEIEG